MKAKKKVCPTCGEMKYLWNRKVGCKECVGKNQRKVGKQPLRVKKPIKKVSGKRKEQGKEYSKLRKDHLDKFPNCVVCGCKADQVHHRMQIRYGKFLNDKTQFMSVCGPHHRMIHDNVAFSIEHGYLASAEEKAKYLRDNL